MGAIDPVKLLEPVSAAQPCGRNLEYTPELLELEAAAREPEEPGIKDVEAVDTRNWRDVLKRSEKLLAESKDLRVAAFLTRALLHVEGWSGFYTGLGVITGIVERYWDGLYPELDELDQDPLARLNAMREMWSTPSLNVLRTTPLVTVRALGNFSLSDVLVAKGIQKPKPGATPPSPQHVLKGLETGATPEMLAQARQGLKDVQTLEALVRQKTGDNFTLDAAPLTDVLARVVSLFNEVVRVPQAAPGPTNSGAEPAAGEGQAQGNTAEQPFAGAGVVPMQIVGQVQSRDDVLQMLEKICDYYEAHEPSSPVPLLMQRAKRLATMNFMEIMKDLADKGLPQVEAVTGKESKG